MNTITKIAMELEASDAQSVNTAMDALLAGKIEQAEAILQKVIANTPANYTNSYEEPDATVIKFWDQAEFIHYVTWSKEHGAGNRNISWILNAYPRAHYYMGFICVKRKQYDKALEYLTKGQQLDPTNCKFIFEKGQAFLQSGRIAEGLAVYEQLSEIGPYVSSDDLAVAWRGRGFALIELGKLQEAQSAFLTSLQLQPGNQNALSELEYIMHLREGGAKSSGQVVQSFDKQVTTCSLCGKADCKKGVVFSFEGSPTFICSKCERKLNKKWWQFWK